MQSDLRDIYTEERELLNNLFETSKLNLTSQVRPDKLQEILSNKYNFPIDTLQELIQEIHPMNEDLILVRDFINVYMSALQALDNRIIEIKNQIKEFHEKKNQLLDELQQVRKNESLNANMIDDDSCVYCNVVQAVGLPQGQYYVQIKIHNEIKMTGLSELGQNIEWNEEFQIPISSPRECVDFTVIQRSQHDTFIGLVTIPVYQLKDQKKQEDLYILEDRSGALGDVNKRLHINIQWVHSKVLLVEDFLREVQYYQPHIVAEEENLKQAITQLETLQSPLRRIHNTVQNRTCLEGQTSQASCECKIF